MRYRLGTLLIVLALGPPMLAPFLAPLLSFLEANPEARQVLVIAGMGLAVLAGV